MSNKKNNFNIQNARYDLKKLSNHKLRVFIQNSLELLYLDKKEKISQEEVVERLKP